jgi:pimeloyl-ACP methyl ester carboxylesterase
MGDTHRITLPDGRTLCYADLGDADGAPVLMMHGTPGYRLNWKALPEYPFLPGVRLIAPDRPGYGLSSPRPGATYADWPADVAALADALHLDRFAVLGGSGGGPPALACGWAMPERVERIALVSSVGPPVHAVLRAVNRTNRTAYALARHVPWLMRRNMRFLAWLQRRDLDGFIDWTSRKLSASDQQRSLARRSEPRCGPRCRPLPSAGTRAATART